MVWIGCPPIIITAATWVSRRRNDQGPQSVFCRTAVCFADHGERAHLVRDLGRRVLPDEWAWHVGACLSRALREGLPGHGDLPILSLLCRYLRSAHYEFADGSAHAGDASPRRSSTDLGSVILFLPRNKTGCGHR